MTLSRTRGLSANPFLQWTNLAFKTAEMMMAATQVVGHRTARMAGAGLNPSERDQREFTLMGQEKLEAATESARAMTERLIRMNGRLWTEASTQMLTGAGAMWGLATSPSLAASLEHHAALVQAVSSGPAVNVFELAGTAARLAHCGLKPIHAKATANARRLGAS